jgi:dienelactone hydrolase
MDLLNQDTTGRTSPMKIVAPVVLLCLATLASSGHAAPPANAEAIWIQLPNGGTASAAVKLEATLYRPAGSNRVPVVMFHHGSSGGPIPANYTEKAASFAAFLNARGIALLVPMRSGRGQSEGPNNEEPSPCTVGAATAGLANATLALDASLAYLRTQPWADMSKIVMAGHSRGGILATVYAAEHPGAVRGVINFSGGWKNDACATPDINLTLFQAAGRKATVPGIFLYAKGDGFYADTSMANYARVYGDAGGSVTFRLYQLSDVNGHLLFRRAQRIWEADVDAFLREAHMVIDPAPVAGLKEYPPETHATARLVESRREYPRLSLRGFNGKMVMLND